VHFLELLFEVLGILWIRMVNLSFDYIDMLQPEKMKKKKKKHWYVEVGFILPSAFNDSFYIL
jgi:hypothetical protein